jgi:hypothetical protein
MILAPLLEVVPETAGAEEGDGAARITTGTCTMRIEWEEEEEEEKIHTKSIIFPDQVKIYSTGAFWG